MKLAFLKRKKVIGVGIAVGLIWVLSRYVFSSNKKTVINVIPHIDVDDSSDKVIGTPVIKYYNKSNRKDNLIFGAQNLRGSRLLIKKGKVIEIEPEIDFYHESEDNDNAKANTKDFSKDVIKNKINSNADFGDKFENKKVDEDDSKVGIVHKTKKKKRKKNLIKSQSFGSENSQKEEASAQEKQPLHAPGENGTAVLIDPKSMSPSELDKYTRLKSTYGYNVFAANKMSLKRSLPDARSDVCKQYDTNSYTLTVSIVIVFYNEALKTLLRTVVSVLHRSPPKLIEEIILVDDGSDIVYLKKDLEDNIKKFKKVHILRTNSRSGVVYGRQLASETAKGSILVFLDSHVEVTNGWLQPLVDTIEANEEDVVASVIDVINDETFEYKFFEYDSINIGGFSWNLNFNWIGVPKRVRKTLKSKKDPISTPTMSGGAFAISARYFKKLGGYDVGMDMWGGDNLEWSFKIWMCGGRLLTHPCSHVGHIFKKGAVYQLGASMNQQKNFQRIAEVWMDDYKKEYYLKTGSKMGDIGDISSRVKLRKKLQCHDFKWYIDNVYPEMFTSSKAIFKGEIRNKMKGRGDGTFFNACLDILESKTLSIWPCHNQGGNQHWMMSREGEIRHEEDCMDFAGEKINLLPCHGQEGNQKWIYLKDKGWIRHEGTQFCMGLNNDSTGLTMGRCTGSPQQMWYWGKNLPTTTWPPKEEYEYEEEEDESKFIRTQTIKEEEEEEEEEEEDDLKKSGRDKLLARSFTTLVESELIKPSKNDYYDNY